MTDDIVARLRLWSDTAKEQDAIDIVVGLCEAADEIERLRERVRIYEGVMRNAKRDIDSLKQQIEDMEVRRG